MVVRGGIGFDVSASACSAVLMTTGRSATDWRLLTSFANAIVLSTSASISRFKFIIRAPLRLTLHQTGVEASSGLHRKGRPRGLVPQPGEQPRCTRGRGRSPADYPPVR